tara:strand:+ start:275 stop:499 length:225 start_codon:yes stop_codon:yes gene_type:complete
VCASIAAFTIFRDCEDFFEPPLVVSINNTSFFLQCAWIDLFKKVLYSKSFDQALIDDALEFKDIADIGFLFLLS